MRFKRSGLFVRLIIAVLLVYAVVTLFSLHKRIEAAKAENAAMAEQVEAQEAQNAELEYDIEHSTDDDVLADIARDKIGLVMPGEEVYYDD